MERVSLALRFHLITTGCLSFGNMHLKAKKQLSNVKARKASLIAFFLFIVFSFCCISPAGGQEGFRMSLIRNS